MNAYLETAVLTASPARLHGMIAEAALRHATAAAGALEAGDREAGHLAASRAIACVAELVNGLAPDAAAPDPGTGTTRELTAALAGQFGFCLEKLSEADRTGAPAPGADAARVLAVHVETWRELLAALPAEGPAGAGPAAAGADGPPVARSWAA